MTDPIQKLNPNTFDLRVNGDIVAFTPESFGVLFDTLNLVIDRMNEQQETIESLLTKVEFGTNTFNVITDRVNKLEARYEGHTHDQRGNSTRDGHAQTGNPTSEWPMRNAYKDQSEWPMRNAYKDQYGGTRA